MNEETEKAMDALVDEYLEKEKALVMKQWKETGVCLDGESEELKALKAEYYEKMQALAAE